MKLVLEWTWVKRVFTKPGSFRAQCLCQHMIGLCDQWLQRWLAGQCRSRKAAALWLEMLDNRPYMAYCSPWGWLCRSTFCNCFVLCLAEPSLSLCGRCRQRRRHRRSWGSWNCQWWSLERWYWNARRLQEEFCPWTERLVGGRGWTSCKSCWQHFDLSQFLVWVLGWEASSLLTCLAR